MARRKPSILLTLNQEGSAMVLTLLVMLVLTGLGAIVVAVGGNNLQNASRDRFSGTADGAAQAGLAQAIEFIRTNGVKDLTCDQPAVAGTDCTKDWGKDNPHIVNVGPDRQYSTWIQRVQKFQFPAFKVGTYRVHSTGKFGSGRGLRVMTQDLTVTPLTFPLGLYSGTNIIANGAPVVKDISMYTRGCIFNRNSISITGTDILTDRPAGANSTQFITTTNNGTCGPTESGNIHKPVPGNPEQGYCNNTFRNDRDAQGGPFTATNACNPPWTNSVFNETMLQDLGFGLPRGLTNGQYAQLKSKAIEQGYFSTTGGNSCGPGGSPPTCWRKPDGDADPNAVLYFEVPAGTTVDIQGSDIDEYKLSTCGTRSLIIVVEGGDIRVSSNLELVGAIFVPDGTYKAAGTTVIDGTLFAKAIDKLTGNHTYDFESCWLSNFPGGLLDINLGRFSEVDR